MACHGRCCLTTLPEMKREAAARQLKRNPATLGAGNALRLKITLRYLTPPIWRRVLVPDHFTLGNLHSVIQATMGWGGGHMHEFRMPPRGFGPPLRRFGQEGEDEDATLVRDVLVRKGQMLLYEYDFGDGWLHGIQLEQILPREAGRRYPVCVAGARSCPPDDCGGPPGYDQLVKALQNPSAPSNAELLEWCGEWDPESFDPEAVNRLLGA
ncbi:transposase [Verrucomicrobia bacterium]|nr:transposase [Verrucomicrobiota bacterium]